MAYCILKSYKLKVNPFQIFKALHSQRHCFFLDSSLSTNHTLGRYSFLGIDPFLIIQAKNKDPLDKIRETLKLYCLKNLRNSIPFLGGAVGYLAYDLGLGVPDCFFGFYNTTLAIDHLRKTLYVFSCGFPEKKSHLAEALAKDNFKKILKLLSQQQPPISTGKSFESKQAVLNSSFTNAGYVQAVKKAKEYIRQGDIYQVNLSQQFCAQTELSAPEIYRRLRAISPSYFNAYFDAGGAQILSSSPEMFLRLRGGKVFTRPMKGTRPRSKNKKKDLKLRQELLQSVKDKAELVMIVDLERNDLGKVCKYNSIKVDRPRELEEYNTVFQTTATVSGKLHKHKDSIDLLAACFPGGSITGCPKIRAMEIIAELEPVRRSIYTGSLGYLSFTGDMEFNILIRTILKKDGKIYFGAGSGIVADSKPQAEYEETLVKAKAMIEALKGDTPP